MVIDSKKKNLVIQSTEICPETPEDLVEFRKLWLNQLKCLYDLTKS